MQVFLSIVNTAVRSTLLTALAKNLPKSVISCRTVLRISDKSFTKHVSCVKCHSVFEYDKCIEKGLSGKLKSKRCPYIAYAKHPQVKHRQPCGALLLKEVRHGHKTFCYPFRTFCWKSITDSLQMLLSRPGFLQKCEHWRTRRVQTGMLKDVYDGRVWSDFQQVNGRNFLKQPHSLGFMMNVDWFQPFKRTTYSIGVIYLVIMNLPREERFLPENTIIYGIIPGPSEPSYNINSYLCELVSDLKKLWIGVFMEIAGYSLPVLVRAALLCSASDLPATRKTCGFTSHNSTMGCSKCLKAFKIKVGEHSDYSGYDRQNWVKRTNMHHRHNSLLHLKAQTKSAQTTISKATGVRYTILQDLEYLDCVRFHIVDPMHNLLLGTAKHVLSVWIKLQIITPSKYDEIQACVDSFTFPSDIGRIPYKIASGFSGFTADQWRTWTVILSPVILKEILPPLHYRCWSLFIEACYILCTRTVSLDAVEKADDLLLEFCTTFYNIYGSDYCTANMHMHCHLKDSIVDYGPVYSFWLFSFKRFNGILGSIPSNKRSIEAQLMKRFICDQQLHSHAFTSELQESSTHKILSSYHVTKGSVAQQTNAGADETCYSSSSEILKSSNFTILGRVTEAVLETNNIEMLSSIYSSELPNTFVKCLHSYKKIGAIQYKGRIFGSIISRRLKAAYVQAKQPRSGYSAAQIDYYCLHKVVIKENEQERIIEQICAAVSWYEEHPEQKWFCKPALIYCKNFHSQGFVFLPNIVCRLSTCIKTVDFHYGPESVLCVVPLEG